MPLKNARCRKGVSHHRRLIDRSAERKMSMSTSPRDVCVALRDWHRSGSRRRAISLFEMRVIIGTVHATRTGELGEGSTRVVVGRRGLCRRLHCQMRCGA